MKIEDVKTSVLESQLEDLEMRRDMWQLDEMETEWMINFYKYQIKKAKEELERRKQNGND